MTIERLLAAPGVLVIDGGLSTQLESMGHELHDPLWTARALLDDPQAVARAHRAFVDAGARIVISASYQVSRLGFDAVGRDAAAADQALRASVEVARHATAGTEVLVAASVGPYGAIWHDGGEYRGNYGLDEGWLADFHAERIAILVDAGPDLLAVETIPDAVEARALARVLPMDLPAWVCFTAGDETALRAGQPIEEAIAAVADHPGVVAVGINCTEPMHVPGLLRRMRSVTDLPLMAYPNAGGSWDPVSGTWMGPRQPITEAALEWVQAGAKIVGGCCGTAADEIAVLARAFDPRPSGCDGNIG